MLVRLTGDSQMCHDLRVCGVNNKLSATTTLPLLLLPLLLVPLQLQLQLGLFLLLLLLLLLLLPGLLLSQIIVFARRMAPTERR